jgi:hypothetical protein
MNKLWKSGFAGLFFLCCFFIYAAPAKTTPAKKPVKYSCEEYAGSLVKLDTNGKILVPWPDGNHTDMIFSDGIFMLDDDTRIIVILLKKSPEVNQFGHTAFFKIFNTVDKSWTDIGTEALDEKHSIVPVKADSAVFSFIKLPDALQPEQPVEMASYTVSDKSRTSVYLQDQTAIKRQLYYGKYELSGLSTEPIVNNYSEFISAQRLENDGELYDGLVTVQRNTRVKTEVLRFGNNPCYLRHSGNITFDYKDRRNFLFGFYNVPAKNMIYYMDGNNMVFRHYENGVGVKEYLNLTRLRAVSQTMSKLLFMAEDDFGARIIVLPFDMKMLSQ